MLNIYYWEKLTFSKLRFSRKENLKKCTNFEEQKGTKYIRGEQLYWHNSLHISFAFKSVSQISFKLFCSGDKMLLSEFLWKWGWFQGHNESFPKYPGYKLKFQKLRHGFADEGAMTKTTLKSSCHWKTLVRFCLRSENALLTLTVNYHKIIQKTNYPFQNNTKMAI